MPHFLKTLLRDWCAATEAVGAMLVRYPPLGCPCLPDGPATARPYRTVSMVTRCPLRTRNDRHVIARVGSTARADICLTHRLPSGDIVALQVALPVAARPPVESLLGSISALGGPLLLLTAEMLNHGSEVRSVRQQLQNQEAHARAELHRLVQGHEQEREWLALEVHDRVAQTLASVFQQLQTIEQLARAIPEIRAIAIRGSSLAREAIREARGLMNELRPPLLEALGLVPLIEEELHQFEEDTRCVARFHPVSARRPSQEVELVAYRVFHEALVNVRRHAQAQRVLVTLRCDEDGVWLEVRDNGVGFDGADALAQRRIGGLVSMRRRAELAGGHCVVESTPGNGTRIALQIPLDPSPDREQRPRSGDAP